MADKSVIPPPLGDDISQDSFINATKVNDMRIASVMGRMRNKFQDSAPFNSLELYDLCLSLARGIDFCVAHQQIPPEAQQLPLLLKQVTVFELSGGWLDKQLRLPCACTSGSSQMCQPKQDSSLCAAIMVLMISVKSAIQSNWFPEKDTEELFRLMNEIGKHFSISMVFSVEPSSSHPIISTIMSRFYPRLNMGQILFVLEAKPGFGAYVKDFRVSKQLRHSAVENVRLLVARTDNAEASTCLVTPPQVNFLLNGRGVEKRVNVSMDVGPQMPTNVTAMLKFGTNLLQAIGDFNGSYIIVMALVSETSTLSNLEIQDYVQPDTTLVDPDSDLIEGPSRISLNCPISFKRIKTPVKGHSCKHHQCFDYNNYLGINSKKPSWRCPICNSHVCFTDIRIDQNMVKVLIEIGENVNEVIISSDGSWKAIMEGDDHLEKLREKFSGEDLEMPDVDSGGILDLTGLDDEMDAIKNYDFDDRKVARKISHIASGADIELINLHLNNTNATGLNTSTDIQDDFWSGIYQSTFPSKTPNDVSDSRDGITPDPSPANLVLPPVSTDVIALAPNLDAVASTSTGNALVAIPGSQNELSSPTGCQLQQYQHGDIAPRNEYGRSLPMPRHITRTPNAVQALPAQPSNPGFHRPRNSESTRVQPVSLTAPQAYAAPLTGDGYPASPGSMERMAQFSVSHVNSQFSRSHANSQMAASSLQPHFNALHNRPHYSVPQSQQYSGSRAPNQQQPGGQFQSVAQPTLNYSRAQGVQGGPPGIPSPGGQFQSVAQPTPNYSRAQGVQGGPPGISSPNVGGNGLLQYRHQAAQVAKVFQTPSATRPVTEVEGFVHGTGDNWRPTGRMRGSLSGQAYSEALSHYTHPITQQANRGAPSLPLAAVTSSQLQILMANRAALQEASSPTTGLSNMSSPSGVLPHESPRMN